MSETSMTASDEDRDALARALHDASEIGGVTPPWDREQPEGRQHWLALSDAALAWFASRPQAAPSACCEATDVVDGHWLVEVHQHCTCGDGGPMGHEPGCGTVPLIDLAGLPGGEHLLAAPSVSRPEADALPSWATALDHVCITAKCSGCGEHVSQFEDSGVAHFDSIEDALASIADDDDDADHVVIGDELLCRNCRDKRECERVGHDWVHHESFLGPYSRTVPEFWTCSLCGHGSKTDPTLTHEVTP